MPATKREQELIDILEPLAAAHGIELVDIDVAGGSKSPVIRVYIDSEHAISFDELAAANSWIGDAVEERDPFPGAYVLEVSSPGIDRPLRKEADYKRFAGEEVVIKVEKSAQAALGGRGTVTGRLCGLDDGCVRVATDGGEMRLPLEGIRKAHIKGHVDFARKD